MSKSYSEDYISPESKAQEKHEGEKVDEAMFSFHHLPRGFRVVHSKGGIREWDVLARGSEFKVILGCVPYGYVRPCLKTKQMTG